MKPSKEMFDILTDLWLRAIHAPSPDGESEGMLHDLADTYQLWLDEAIEPDEGDELFANLRVAFTDTLEVLRDEGHHDIAAALIAIRPNLCPWPADKADTN